MALLARKFFLRRSHLDLFLCQRLTKVSFKHLVHFWKQRLQGICRESNLEMYLEGANRQFRISLDRRNRMPLFFQALGLRNHADWNAYTMILLVPSPVNREAWSTSAGTRCHRSWKWKRKSANNQVEVHHHLEADMTDHNKIMSLSIPKSLRKVKKQAWLKIL